MKVVALGYFLLAVLGGICLRKELRAQSRRDVLVLWAIYCGFVALLWFGPLIAGWGFLTFVDTTPNAAKQPRYFYQSTDVSDAKREGK